jgi:hypothetical protein
MTNFICVLLVMVGCFQPQFLFLPIFLWSFIALLLAWLLMQMRNKLNIKKFPISLERYEIYGVSFLLLPVIFHGGNLVSQMYLVSSMACALMSVLTVSDCPVLIRQSILAFLFLNLALLVIGMVEMQIFGGESIFFVYSDSGEYLRFRGLQLEPNHLGFSLIAIYIVLLFCPSEYLKSNRVEKGVSHAILLLLAFGTFSPFTYFMLGMVAVFYAWTTWKRKLLVVCVIALAVLVGVQTERFEQIVTGYDNSANLRTWGSLIIAQAQVDKCGILGCGLGNGRSMLEDEPLMSMFAAQEALVLPNLFAGAMVEGGYIFALLFLIVILIAAFPRVRSKYHASRRCGIAVLLFMMGYTLTGSFPYDAHFWSVLGLIYLVVRVNIFGSVYAK